MIFSCFKEKNAIRQMLTVADSLIKVWSIELNEGMEEEGKWCIHSQIHQCKLQDMLAIIQPSGRTYGALSYIY